MKDLLNHKYQILKTIGICCILALASYFILPRRYKATASVAMQTAYFQIPLVSGFLPETMDPQELRAKREAIVHRAMNHEYIAAVARRHNLIKNSDLESGNSYYLEELEKRFEIIPNGTSSFTISFTAKDPSVTHQVLREFVDHLQAVMTRERHTTLLNLHDAIQDQLEVLSSGKVSGRKIENIQREIETLKATYSAKHPRIAELTGQLAHLKKLPQQEKAWSIDLFAGAKTNADSKELFDDLMKKYRYIGVVMHMDQESKDHYLSYLNEPYIPHSPIWPKLPILLVWGIAAGFLFGSLSVLFNLHLRTIPIPDGLKCLTKLS